MKTKKETIYNKMTNEMTQLQKLIFENANDSKNMSDIIELANEIAWYTKENNDSVEEFEISSTGKIEFTFTQDAMDIETLYDLHEQASEFFHSHFNSSAKIELPNCF